MSKHLPAWAPYVIPFAVYLALTAVEVRFPGQYPAFYSVKIFVSALLAWIMRPQGAAWPKVNWTWILAAVTIGVALNWVWFAVDKVTPHPQWLTSIMGKRASFNP